MIPLFPAPAVVAEVRVALVDGDGYEADAREQIQSEKINTHFSILFNRRLTPI